MSTHTKTQVETHVSELTGMTPNPTLSQVLATAPWTALAHP